MKNLRNIITVDRITESFASLADRVSISPGGMADYTVGYPALLHLFRERLDTSNLHDIHAGAYAVYGWMPTILKSLPDVGGAQKLIPLIEEARSKLNGFEIENWTHCLKAVNNSVTGTSKFLHFSVPEVFPIWDSLVARTFGIPSRNHYARTEAYCAYFRAVHAWLGTEIMPARLDLALNHAGISTESQKVRGIELALYWEGRHQLLESREVGPFSPS
ncbi:hypothetical protein GF108_01230 [Phyllobacterium sp. SYP-B3895]|uniref:hypothetical protein n=1 Tax=Phyllobacterium sp. SYP-B3895 TaxID=2663240 RepID=UPI001299C34E|nr:hypothetical protein [Phyllobacterium sp. SYP-B3895]MRG54205.1 hypothetical protein [Phyllobacterium sp. SYP-B3895]